MSVNPRVYPFLAIAENLATITVTTSEKDLSNTYAAIGTLVDELRPLVVEVPDTQFVASIDAARTSRSRDVGGIEADARQRVKTITAGG